MFNLVDIVSWIAIFWDKLPESLKKVIIDAIIFGFTDIFEGYYQDYKNNQN